MKKVSVSNKKIFISILTLALISSFSGQAVSSASFETVELKLSGDTLFFDDHEINRLKSDGHEFKLNSPAAPDACVSEIKNTDYNEKLSEIVKKYNEKRRIAYLAAMEKYWLNNQKGFENKGAFTKDGPRPDMKEMNRMGRPDHDMKGRGADRPSDNTKSGITRYTPPGEKIDPLCSLEQPNQTTDVFSYAGSLIFGMIMRYPVEYIKKYAQNYANKNYKKQIDRTRQTVSDVYHKPVRTIKNSISKNFFGGGTNEVNLNFFYMRSTMGIRMNY